MSILTRSILGGGLALTLACLGCQPSPIAVTGDAPVPAASNAPFAWGELLGQASVPVVAGFGIKDLAALRATVADSADRPGTMLEILLLVAVVFVVLVLVLSWIQNRMEKKWKVAR